MVPSMIMDQHMTKQGARGALFLDEHIREEVKETGDTSLFHRNIGSLRILLAVSKIVYVRHSQWEGDSGRPTHIHKPAIIVNIVFRIIQTS